MSPHTDLLKRPYRCPWYERLWRWLAAELTP
jgi:hypothetical protein